MKRMMMICMVMACVGMAAASDAQVIFSPKNPIAGQPVTVIYNGFLKKEALVVMHWSYNGFSIPAMNSNMTKQADGSWKVSVKLPELATNKMDAAFHNNVGKWDNNAGADYHATLATINSPLTTITPSSSVRVCFKKPQSWTRVSIYVWINTNTALRNSWPGKSLTSTKTEGLDWYCDTIQNQTSINLIFNDRGSNKTVDLTATSGDWWYKNGTWTSTNPEPTPVTTATPTKRRTVKPTKTPKPTITPTKRPIVKPTATPTKTPRPTATPIATLQPLATPTPTPTPTVQLAIEPTPRPQPASSQKKIALLIGNAAYDDHPLTNPAKDATDMAYTLNRLGFDAQLVTDADRRQMIEAIQTFSESVSDGSVALFYYSGHGLQSQGNNYLIPVRYHAIKKEADIQFEMVDVNLALAHLAESNGSGVNIVILDACRDNPFKGFMKSLRNGLAQMTAPTGSLIIYATAPDTPALDDPSGQNSIYTRRLLEALRTIPDKNIYELLLWVRQQVMADTNNSQVPWDANSLTGLFSFAAPQPTPTATPTPEMSAAAKKQRIVELYRAKSISPEQFERAIHLIKTGEHDQILEDFLNDRISLETFRETF